MARCSGRLRCTVVIRLVCLSEALQTAFHLVVDEDEVEDGVKYETEHRYYVAVTTLSQRTIADSQRSDAHFGNVMFTMQGDQPVKAHLFDW
ncbi:hypothetical protein PAXRUDRAFT_828521 [Paxillus rubicundulus Ve08.2h10]|uniref:Uncharacterized protein n=1 Tax=Paxillus rubicundulus Ve08.2h10 TaxID=930991 RepID=A0A0D0E168_9AGAM|nr:hypothetical protein PAXRUDRAFT_828521 [Paxillus rubicundulus Ve08.2h10]